MQGARARRDGVRWIQGGQRIEQDPDPHRYHAVPGHHRMDGHRWWPISLQYLHQLSGSEFLGSHEVGSLCKTQAEHRRLDHSFAVVESRA